MTAYARLKTVNNDRSWMIAALPSRWISFRFISEIGNLAFALLGWPTHFGRWHILGPALLAFPPSEFVRLIRYAICRNVSVSRRPC
jgi:hypothetical protein